MTPGSLLLAPRSSPVAIASACWTVYVENNGRWQMAAHQSGRPENFYKIFYGLRRGLGCSGFRKHKGSPGSSKSEGRHRHAGALKK